MDLFRGLHAIRGFQMQCRRHFGLQVHRAQSSKALAILFGLPATMVKVPPCEMEAEQRKHMHRTYVAKVSAASEPEMLRSLRLQCQSWLFGGKVNAYALVDVPEHIGI